MGRRHKYIFPISIAAICLTLTVQAWGTFKVTKRLYIDGVFVEGVVAPVGLIYPYDRINLACEGTSWNMYNCLDGAIDEFAIYKYLLSPNDVNEHFTAAQISEPNYMAEVSSDNPLIYLRFEDASMADGQPAADNAPPSSSAGRNGTYISNNITPVTGIFSIDQAAKFAGNSTPGCVDIWDGDSAFSLENISIELWVKSTELGTNYPRLFQHNGSWLNQSAYGVTTKPDANDIIQVGLIGGGSTDYFNVNFFDINDGQWHHIVTTYETIFDPCGYPNEVAADNPLIWFRFEEEIGRDVSVVNYGSLTVDAKYVGRNPHFAPGKVGKGVFLHDNGDEAITIFSPGYAGDGDYSHLYALTPGDMSVEVWFRAWPHDQYCEDGQLNWARLYSNNGTYNNKDSARTYLTADGYYTGAGSQGPYAGTYMYTKHPGYNPYAPEPNLTGPADSDWHHLVVTYDVNDTGPYDPNVDPGIYIKFYLDGALFDHYWVEANLPVTTGILGPEFREFVIGADGSSDGERWNCFLGTLDEFALYDHLLSQERIGIHYAEGMTEQPWAPENCEDIYKFDWNRSTDKNGDCRVDFEDMVDMGNDWWRCNEPDDYSCEKPWL